MRRLGLVAVFLGVCLLAAGLPRLELAPADWASLRQAISLGSLAGPAKEFLRNLGAVLLASAALSTALLVLALIGPRRKKKEHDEFVWTFVPQRSWPTLILMALLWFCLGVGGWWLWKSAVSDEAVPPGPPLETPLEAPRLAGPEATESPHPASSELLPPGIGRLLGVGAALLGACLAWRKFRKRPSGEQPDSIESVEMRKAAAQAIEDLKRGKDITDVVLRCYREVYRILEARVWNGPSLTAREFARRLVEAGVSAPEVTTLTTLFEMVRYGRRVTGASERREAMAALEVIQRRYGENQADAV